jgi:hypothetical protein
MVGTDVFGLLDFNQEVFMVRTPLKKAPLGGL